MKRKTRKNWAQMEDVVAGIIRHYLEWTDAQVNGGKRERGFPTKIRSYLKSVVAVIEGTEEGDFISDLGLFLAGLYIGKWGCPAPADIHEMARGLRKRQGVRQATLDWEEVMRMDDGKIAPEDLFALARERNLLPNCTLGSFLRVLAEKRKEKRDGLRPRKP